jgi:cell division protein FtsZ
MGIGIASGEGRASEAAKKAISSPLLETSIEGAQGVLMNITSGTDLSLYEVQEAADVVAAATDQELNMIFGSVINENFKGEMMVTVIATGFDDQEIPSLKPSSRNFSDKPQSQSHRREPIKREKPVRDYKQQPQHPEESLDIPTFLRNRK